MLGIYRSFTSLFFSFVYSVFLLVFLPEATCFLLCFQHAYLEQAAQLHEPCTCPCTTKEKRCIKQKWGKEVGREADFLAATSEQGWFSHRSLEPLTHFIPKAMTLATQMPQGFASSSWHSDSGEYVGKNLPIKITPSADLSWTCWKAKQLQHFQQLSAENTWLPGINHLCSQLFFFWSPMSPGGLSIAPSPKGSSPWLSPTVPLHWDLQGELPCEVPGGSELLLLASGFHVLLKNPREMNGSCELLHTSTLIWL